ncbi:MAG: hypothetical protein V3V76_08000 [Candidatus Adiutricales bacterium]
MKKMHVMTVAAIFILGAFLIPSLGFAEEFNYAGPPAFTVELPDDAQKGEANADEGQVWTGKAGGGVTLTISVFDIPKDVSTKDYCQKSYIPGLVEGYDHFEMDDLEFLGNEEYELDDGTMAWKCEFEWPWTDGSTILTTYLMVADKGGKRVTIDTHPWASADEVIEALESLTFE